MSLTFHIVYVYAEEQYAGNQLAIVRGARDLPDETLRWDPSVSFQRVFSFKQPLAKRISHRTLEK